MTRGVPGGCEPRVYSQIVPHAITADEVVALRPAALILSGGPSSVYEPGAPHLDPAILDPAILGLGIPVLGICYGFQAMAQALGGVVANDGNREFGGTILQVRLPGRLFAGLPEHQEVWMSHGDRVVTAPPGFTVTAETPGLPPAVARNGPVAMQARG